MKKYFFIPILLLLSAGLFAQTLRIDVTDTTASGEPGGSFVLKGYVHNIGNAAEVVQLTRKTNDIPDGWTTTLCFGSSCYPSFVDKPDPVGINPGDSVFFDITFNTDENPGYGEALLLFESLVSGEKDSILFSVTTHMPKKFAIDVTDTVMHSKPGESIVFKGYVHNTSSDAQVIKLTRKINDIPIDWTTTLCFGSSCYPSFVNEPDPVGVNPGDSIFFDIAFNSGQTPDSGKALLLFEDIITGEKDSVWFKASTIAFPAFELLPTDTSAEGIAGNTFELGGYVHNLTDSLLTINLVRILNDLPTGWSSSLCFDVCVSPDQDTVVSAIGPMDSLAYTITVYSADSVSGTANIGLKFFAHGAYDTLYQNFAVSATATGIGKENTLQNRQFRLLGNYPNPFNPQTTIRYQLAEESKVIIDIFNVNGRHVATLFNARQKAGYHQIHFNASALPSGIYYYRLKTRRHNAFGKMILVK